MIPASFPDRARIDARDKVLGVARFSADVPVTGVLYAMMVPARIAKGTLTGLDTAAALRVPGVVRVLTEADFPAPPPVIENGPPPPPPTLEREIAYRGQPVALVVAETLEAAIEGAAAVVCTYAAAPFAALIDSEGGVREMGEEIVFGDAEATLASAAVVVEGEFLSPTQHHNPIELLATTAVWEAGRLTLHEATQGAGGTRGMTARALGIDPGVVDVKSPYVGGGFGQKGGLGQRQTALIAHASMLLGRPVKLVTPRGQIFHLATYRPLSRHRIRLGATAEGRMVAMQYDAEQEQSRHGIFPSAEYHETTSRMYGIANYLGTSADVRIDRQPPGWMRAPHPQASGFAMESMVDELAYRLGQDPVALRLANTGDVDFRTGQPFSSNHLNACLEEGARRFGWSSRTAEPGSMTADDGSLVGWGVACGSYPSMMVPAVATLRIGADGSTRYAASGHEMGQGIRTAIASVLLESLEIDPERLEILIGDTTAAPQHITAGSWGSAGAVPVAMRAAARMREAVAELLDGREIAGNLHRRLATVRRPFLEIEVSEVGPGQGQDVLQALQYGAPAVAGPAYPTFTTMSYIAHFVEVRVEPTTRRVRVPRVVSIVDCGRVISPRTAESQVRGGVVWAIGAALREATEVDPRYGGYLNNDLADYVVAVNADIGAIDVGFIDQPDPLANSAGLKGLGEVAMVGASPAIANAIFHATGRRLHELPIRIEHLL
ncbi:xanthine dehydrogenase family protein molybdopterin-binding subunit [Methylobrevis albus]|uniref:Xanthine dehydrogenase family protein molybdopterin-binding subunit n=1 Tax=Methylobrevis albus TaxID=2793297 RepID=A0A931I2B9_9HYPH|nr:xanthine dehydrogenase family protein molybdopterin-binding subunit [Methylobrevis albus]MBH0238008.1 xanthine dehydrogenase family protein molybdopterin-binding subunit [Methylobrevis albus]